ncbi:hypothetical protein [Aeoliella sp. SH292]|uniref:hypothetical protein n=1 Tax=Aeoliella sp. SH292 TaxID=3454464 RepID=UPI003F95B7B5
MLSTFAISEVSGQNPLGQRINWIGPVGVEAQWNEPEGGLENGANWQDIGFGNYQPDRTVSPPEYASISTTGGTGRAVISSAIATHPTDIIIGQDSGTAGSLIVRDGGSITVQASGATGNGELIVGAGGTGNLGLEDDMGAVSVQKYTQGNNGLLVARLSGAGTFTQRVQSTGGISLDGRLLVERLAGSDFKLTTGNSWTLISGSPVTGNFDQVTVAPELLNSPGQTLAVSTSGNAVTMSVSQRLVLNVDRYTGAATLVNEAGHSVNIDLVEYTLASTAGNLNGANGRWKSFDDDPSKPNWIEAGATEFALSEVNGGARLVAASGFQHDFGTPFDVNTSAAKGVSRVDLSGVSFLYADPDTGTQQAAAINIVGAANDMALVVNPVTGNATIQNQFGQAIDFISYTISSASGSLLPNSFSGVDGGNGPDWFEANWTTTDLSEAIGGAPAESLSFLESLDLGIAWDAAAGERDLTFRYQDPTTGQLISGLVYYGDVVESPGSVGGDYNGDGIVNLADYTVWRDNLGGDASALAAGTRNPSNTGPISAADYSFWKSNFGNSALGGLNASPANVPEPATCVMLIAGALALAVARKRS